MLARLFPQVPESAERGFLPINNPVAKLPDVCQYNTDINRLVQDLPELLKKKELRKTVDALSAAIDGDAADLLQVSNNAEKNAALTFLTALAQAYVFENAEQPIEAVPAFISVPLYNLAKEKQRFPTVTYNDYVLNNWRKLNAEGGVTLENIEPLVTLTGTRDEQWFIMVHVAIEAAAAPAILAAKKAFVEARNESPDADALTSAMHTIKASVEEAIKIMRRMQEECNPDAFWNVLRPYLGGWEKTKPADCEDAGVRFAGVGVKDTKPFAFSGPSGAQSSIVPALDAVLGVRHEINGMFQQLLKFKEYMPTEHQALINVFAAFSGVQQAVQHANDDKLTAAYEGAVNAVKQMRGAHLGLVKQYIYKPAVACGIPKEALTGTGGAPIDSYLAGRYKDTPAHALTQQKH